MIRVYDRQRDQVIDATFLVASTTYRVALEKIYPLINKLDIQRRLQNNKFYRRLEEDLINGCVMPPITLAFIVENDFDFNGNAEAQDFIFNSINDAFVLDGIQRLNTLYRASERMDDNQLQRPIYLNVIICKSMDNLLYRMITLNNGQKPMTIRHQIEMLASNLYDFESLNIKIKTEKDRRAGMNSAFKKEDIIKAYTAFLGASVNFDNQKIVEDKLNEILAEKIIDSNITSSKIDFNNLIDFVKDASDSQDELLDWFRNSNNLIGFAAGVAKYDSLPKNIGEFEAFTGNFEEAMRYGFEVSKIKLGQTRRRLIYECISNYDTYKNMTANELIDELSRFA